MEDINTLPLPELYRRLQSTGLIHRLLLLARDEDLGEPGPLSDVTSAVTVPEREAGAAAMVARSTGVIAGMAAVPELLSAFGCDVSVRDAFADGQRAPSGATLTELRGLKRDLLAIERTALNLIGRLSGIATLTAEFVAAIGSGTRAAIYDTRKTTPGLRALEKYAVRCGGGRCHRLGLHDAVLIKDNHLTGVPTAKIAACVAEASATARRLHPRIQFVEVEVDSLEQLAQVLTLPQGSVDIVLLDNMDLHALREAVRMRDAVATRPELEASGGARLETVRAIAQTGVERISVGALTHRAVSLDVALDMLPGTE
jgi:nicotinate-nucleotide pyrophosphorylase (carboxylating)